MRAVARVLIAGTLVFSAGCAKTDWIDRTLVTVDVTGTWYGTAAGGTVGSEMWFELDQQGSTVKGLVRYRGPTGNIGELSGPVEGTVGGDVFRFRNMRGNLEGEMTINGDEMTGLVSTSFGRRPLSLQRVEPSSRPASPPR
jgi:hypothetical protein